MTSRAMHGSHLGPGEFTEQPFLVSTQRTGLSFVNFASAREDALPWHVTHISLMRRTAEVQQPSMRCEVAEVDSVMIRSTSFSG